MDKLTISNMELYYGDFKALKGINLNIQANEITAFIGPSGCGKSTLLKSLNRMNDLVEGCRITGSILLRWRGHLRRHGHQPSEKTGWYGIPETESVPNERL